MKWIIVAILCVVGFYYFVWQGPQTRKQDVKKALADVRKVAADTYEGVSSAVNAVKNEVSDRISSDNTKTTDSKAKPQEATFDAGFTKGDNAKAPDSKPKIETPKEEKTGAKDIFEDLRTSTRELVDSVKTLLSQERGDDSYGK